MGSAQSVLASGHASPAEVAHAVDCRDVVKSYGSHVALHGVSLAIRPNEFFTLLGPSGCGKTTLLRAIAGFVSLDRGSIAVNGRDLGRLPPYRRPVNTVFQNYAVFPHMTVEQNIAFGLEMSGRSKRDIAERVREMLALVRLDGLGARMPSQLSGGQQQRVAFARALAPAPRVLLLDEPLSALDQKLRAGMQLELKRLQRDVGITFVFVTHDQHEALTMSDRIAVMDGGRILQVGTPQDIYERPETRFVADFIGDANLLSARASSAGRYRIASGIEIDAPASAFEGQEVTLAIRPERVQLRGPEAGTLPATVEQVVYEGVRTTYYVALGGERLRICEQNQEGARARYVPGDAVHVVVPPEAVRVLAA